MIIKSDASLRPLASVQFHQGVDIAGGRGEKVYAVTDGWIHHVTGDRVDVSAGVTRSFQYYHVRSTLKSGERVVAGVTVIGTIKREAGHVHLTEIDGGRVINPLLHLYPYVDRIPPTVHGVELTTVSGGRVATDDVSGRVVISARADDSQTGDVAGAWHGMPVAPAVIDWGLTNEHGSVVRRMQRVMDFRRRIPLPRRFWSVYADSTRQNFPVIDNKFNFRRPGRFDFLIANPLDTRVFPNGSYVIDVRAMDSCGNTADLREPITIRNP